MRLLGRIMVIVATILLIACDKEVSRTYLPSYTEQRMVGCTTPGVCYKCSTDVDGDYTCGFGFSLSCGGKRPAEVKIQPYEAQYESGTSRRFEDTAIQGYAGSCQQD